MAWQDAGLVRAGDHLTDSVLRLLGRIDTQAAVNTSRLLEHDLLTRVQVLQLRVVACVCVACVGRGRLLVARLRATNSLALRHVWSLGVDGRAGQLLLLGSLGLSSDSAFPATLFRAVRPHEFGRARRYLDLMAGSASL